MKAPPEITTPCPKCWEEMRGDSRSRFGEHCKLHVHNLSAISAHHVGTVLSRSGRECVCVTYVRRSDGSMVTRLDTILEFLFWPIRRGFDWLFAACLPIVLSACQTQKQYRSGCAEVPFTAAEGSAGRARFRYRRHRWLNGHRSTVLMETRLTPSAIVGIVALLICTPTFTLATPPAGWKLYSGAWFDISYPRAFTPVPVQKSRTSVEGADSVAFVSPSHDVEFYVFSPQWAGRASALDIDPARERLTSKKVTVSDYRHGGTILEKGAMTDTWLGISALDGSYVRFVHHQVNSFVHTTLVFGIKCRDMKTYNRYKADYVRFRKSLVQYADGM